MNIRVTGTTDQRRSCTRGEGGAINMLVLIAIAFIVCSLPLHIYRIFYSFHIEVRGIINGNMKYILIYNFLISFIKFLILLISYLYPMNLFKRKYKIVYTILSTISMTTMYYYLIILYLTIYIYNYIM